MGTTQTPVRIESLPRMADDPHAMSELRDGLLNAIAELHVEALLDVYEGEAGWSWDRLTAAVGDELAAQVAPLIDAALARRLPWEWPEVRS
jgi:hypothetical protein